MGWRGGGCLIGHEKADVKTRTTSQRWTDVEMSGCVSLCFFDRASSCASAFYFFQMSLRVYVGCFSVGCHVLFGSGLGMVM